MAETGGRFRVGVQFRTWGDVRFLSHGDVMRMMQRAVVRAGLPLRYSRGFNPQPRLSLPVPRSVGMASDDEWLVLELIEPVGTSRIQQDLSGQMPKGIEIQTVIELPGTCSLQPRAVEYEVDLSHLSVDPAEMKDRVERLRAAASVSVTRCSPKHPALRERDIRSSIEAIELHQGRLLLQLTHTSTKLARPTEVLAALSLPVEELRHRILRRRIIWKEPAPTTAGMEHNPKEKSNDRYH